VQVYAISKQFAFDAAHRLDGLPAGHKCGRVHGHTYRAEFVLQADEPDPTTGFVRDYGDLDPVRAWIAAYLDHRDLNTDLVAGLHRPPAPPLGLEVLGQPSAERIARWMFARWCVPIPELVEVRVSETPNTWACYRL